MKKSNNKPLIKELNDVKSFKKLKARHRNKQYSSILNDAFDDSIGTRCITTTSNTSDLSENDYYIFPINGFKFLYDPQGMSGTSYHELTDTIKTDLVKELMRFNLEESDLNHALSINTEVVLYNIPFCYAVNVKSFNSYDELLSVIK